MSSSCVDAGHLLWVWWSGSVPLVSDWHELNGTDQSRASAEAHTHACSPRTNGRKIKKTKHKMKAGQLAWGPLKDMKSVFSTSLQVKSNCFDTFQIIFFSFSERWAGGCYLTAQHVWLNKQDIILVPFFVWIFTYSCLWHADSSWWAWAPTDTLVPRLHRSCSTRAKAGSQCPTHPKIPPVTPSTPQQSTQQWHPLVRRFQKKEFDESDATNNHPGLINTQERVTRLLVKQLYGALLSMTNDTFASKPDYANVIILSTLKHSFTWFKFHMVTSQPREGCC